MTATYQANWPRPTTREEEAGLSAAILAGGPDALDARNRLASAHLALAMKFARRMAPVLGMDVGDAFGAAQLGLIRAAETFDAAKGRFTTYATAWIRQKIHVHAAESTGAARPPLYQMKSPDAGLPFSAEAEAARRRPASLSGTPGDKGPWAETLADTREEAPDDEGRLAVVRAEAARLLAVLRGREREAVVRYFGLGCDRETLVEIGRDFGVSRKRAQAIKDRALWRMAKLTEAVAC
jgi:RNA polymerase sigma factor (sigma-70 family)